MKRMVYREFSFELEVIGDRIKICFPVKGRKILLELDNVALQLYSFLWEIENELWFFARL